jgi:hypothetical protein
LLLLMTGMKIEIWRKKRERSLLWQWLGPFPLSFCCVLFSHYGYKNLVRIQILKKWYMKTKFKNTKIT